MQDPTADGFVKLRMPKSNPNNSLGNARVATVIAISSGLILCAQSAQARHDDSNSAADTSMRPIKIAIKRSEFEERERERLKQELDEETQKKEGKKKKNNEPEIPEGFGSEKPSLGVKLVETGPNQVTVSEIMPGSGAYGVLQSGDQIMFIAGVKLTTLGQMQSIMGSRAFNEKIEVQALRGGEKITLNIILRQFTAPVGESGSTAPSIASAATGGSGTPTSSADRSATGGPMRLAPPSSSAAPSPADTMPTQGTLITPPSGTATIATNDPTSATPNATTSALPPPSIRVGASTPPIEPLIPVGASTPSLSDLEGSNSSKGTTSQSSKTAPKAVASATTSKSTSTSTTVPAKGESKTAPAASTQSVAVATAAPSVTAPASSTSTPSSTSNASGTSTSKGPTAKDYLEAEKKLTQALIEDFAKRADVYRKLERFDAALEDYSAIAKLDPKSPLSCSGRGRTFAAMQKNKEAITEFTNALQIDPNSAWDYTYRGMVYWQEKDFPKALADFNKAIQINPELHKAYVYRGNCYDSMGKTTEGLADLTKAVQLDSKGELKGEPYKWRAVLYEKMGSERRSSQDKEKVDELGLLPMFD